MIGRVVDFTGSTDAIARLEKTLRNECVQALRALPKLAALHVMVNHQIGKAVVLAIWEDTASADHAMEAMIPLRRQIVDDGIAQSMTDYEVVS